MIHNHLDIHWSTKRETRRITLIKLNGQSRLDTSQSRQTTNQPRMENEYTNMCLPVNVSYIGHLKEKKPKQDLVLFSCLVKRINQHVVFISLRSWSLNRIHTHQKKYKTDGWPSRSNFFLTLCAFVSVCSILENTRNDNRNKNQIIVNHVLVQLSFLQPIRI